MRFLPLLITLVSLNAWTNAWALTVPPAIEGSNVVDHSAVQVNPRDGTKITVVAFVSARCPCSASHEPVLAELSKEFAKEARFIGVHSNADETADESAEHFKKAALPFPVIQDKGSHIADALGAVKTPHVFVLSSRGEVLFQGGVDDSHDAKKSTKKYLKQALEALRAGRAPEINLARSLGCQIRR